MDDKITREHAILIVEQAVLYLPLRAYWRSFQAYATMNPGCHAARLRRRDTNKSKRLHYWLDRQANPKAAACFYKYVEAVQKAAHVLDFFYVAFDFLQMAQETKVMVKWHSLFVQNFLPFINEGQSGEAMLSMKMVPQDYRVVFGIVFEDCVRYSASAI